MGGERGRGGRVGGEGREGGWEGREGGRGSVRAIVDQIPLTFVARSSDLHELAYINSWLLLQQKTGTEIIKSKVFFFTPKL